MYKMNDLYNVHRNHNLFLFLGVKKILNGSVKPMSNSFGSPNFHSTLFQALFCSSKAHTFVFFLYPIFSLLSPGDLLTSIMASIAKPFSSRCYRSFWELGRHLFTLNFTFRMVWLSHKSKCTKAALLV